MGTHGKPSLCFRNQDVRYQEKRGAPQSLQVWGPQSPGWGTRRFVAAWCREGKWPRLMVSGRFNRTGLRDCKGPGESGRGVCGRALASWEQKAAAEFWRWLSHAALCVDGHPGCQPSFLGPRPSWKSPSVIKTAQLVLGLPQEPGWLSTSFPLWACVLGEWYYLPH